jgi:hypothetical protein
MDSRIGTPPLPRPRPGVEPVGGGIQTLGPLKGAAAPNEADRYIQAAMQFVDQPYKWGGGHVDKTGVMPVDCSGLVLQAARMVGRNFDGTAADQQKMGKPVGMDELQPGDLLFKGNPASHVGIYLGEGKFLHAPQTGDVVKVSDVAEYGNFTEARRVFDAPASGGGNSVRARLDSLAIGSGGQASNLRLP